MRFKNRILPAWIGSILFHTLLVLLILYWFVPSADRTMPGERVAVGSILFRPSGGAKDAERQSTVPPTSEAVSQTAELMTVEKFASVTLTALPPVPAPGRNSTEPAASTASATAVTESFAHGALNHTGSGNMAGETTVKVFETSGKGTRFVFVFDRSDSMEGGLIRRAKAELIQSLDSLGDSHQFNIVAYNNEHIVWQSGAGKRLVFAAPINKRDAIRFIDGLTAAGGTLHYKPLMTAIAYHPDVIFLLTDGETKDDLKPIELAEIERVNSVGRGAQINVIQFGSGNKTDSASKRLQQLAEQNHGGQYQYINITEWRSE